MTTGSKMVITVAGAVAAGVLVNYLLHTEKGSAVAQQLKKAACDFLEKGKDLLVKTKDDAVSDLKETAI